MSTITDKYFGANIVMTINSVQPGSPFIEMLKEVSFTEFRYPGGSVTENATWENGELQSVFGAPMDPDDRDYVMTIREALGFCRDTDVPINVVIPTKQFFDFETGGFRKAAFERYVSELETALKEFPDVDISGFEIGNEYWGHDPQHGFPRFSPAQYAQVVNAEVPAISAMADRLAAASGGEWDKPGIGVQAGAQWRQTAVQESKDIIAGIDTDVRGMITKVYQHHYPAVNKGEHQVRWAFDSVAEFDKAPGFPDDLEVVISEFNVSGGSPEGSGKPFQYGLRIAGQWAEEFGKAIDAGADVFHHWGLQYETLDKKFYDRGVDKDGNVIVAATPIGMIYDLSRKHLIGKATITDGEAAADLGVPEGVTVTGFEDEQQRVVYLHNRTGEAARVNLGEETRAHHLTAYLMMPADDPSTDRDEGVVLADRESWPDSRADMRVVSGTAVGGHLDIPPEGVLVLVATDHGSGLEIEGARRETDPALGMVDDLIIGGTGRDILLGRAGDDRIEGKEGADVLSGGEGNDTLIAEAGNDIIISERGADNISAGEGDDLILVSGKEGRVSLALNGGSNTVLTSGERAMTITGFAAGDRLGLNGAFKSVEDLITATSADQAGTRITLPGGEAVFLTGYFGTPEDLADQMFDFLPAQEARDVLTDHLSGTRVSQAEMVLEAGADLGGLSGQGRAWPDIGQIDTEDDHRPAPPSPPTPPDRPDPDEDPDTGDDETPQDEASGGGGGCFVATAAYGHRTHPEVVALRRFRDQHLIRYAAGRAFVRLYWRAGPAMAARVSPDGLTGRVIRAGLDRLTERLRRADLTGGK